MDKARKSVPLMRILPREQIGANGNVLLRADFLLSSVLLIDTAVGKLSYH